MRFRKTYKAISCTLLIAFVMEVAIPASVFALTGGPSQPEVQSFEPIETSQMVDLSSGDFTYNIPLLDMDGYPLNISYHSGVSMDQEASIVGLGWNLNPGVISRNMRGLPDDYKGDEVVREMSYKDNISAGLSLPVELSVKLFGKKRGLPLSSFGITYNNYRGMGVTADLSFGHKFKTKNSKYTADLGLNISLSSQDGLGIKPSLAFSGQMGEKNRRFASKVGINYNTRQGLSKLTYSANITKDVIKNDRKRMMSRKYENAQKLNTSSSVSFANRSFTPQYENSSSSYSASLDLSFGGGTFGTLTIQPFSAQGSFSMNSLTENVTTTPAYGFFYSHNADDNADDKFNVLMDFNREKDGRFIKKVTPHLPITSFSCDIYSASGQGVGGSYKPYRSDVGTLFDRTSKSTTSDGLNLGVDLAFGPPPPLPNDIHGGISATVDISWSKSGKWIKGNDTKDIFDFQDKREDGNPLYEPFYLKRQGEMAATEDKEFLNFMGGYDAVALELKNARKVNPKYYQGESLSGAEKSSTRQDRDKRNQDIILQTAKEASEYGLDKKINVYPMNASPLTTAPVPIGREDGEHRKAHHISEVTVLRPDGMRYVYGIPAYNIKKHEVTFAMGNNGDPDCSTGLMNYTENDANINENDNGLDHYINIMKTPGYAHSYLLTAIVTPDYVDVTGDGPTDDDLGNYTKFNYTSKNAEPGNKYQWRIPYHGANYNQGLESDKAFNNQEVIDDKGSYIYGEKEIWYLHSVVSKNYLAEFEYSPRNDGIGAAQEYVPNEGASLTNTGDHNLSYKLDKIFLYGKHERIKHLENAIPIKTVHFRYNYALCEEIHNYKAGLDERTEDRLTSPGTGKLTLKEVFFTYGAAKRGRLNAYKFDYEENDPSRNPNYNIKGYDRWGCFKPNLAASGCDGSQLSNIDYPYVDQDNPEDKIHKYSSAWTLRHIKLPSGGIINIEYESDDYAFVQDKFAMEMTKIVSVRETATSSANSNWLVGLSKGRTNYNYIFFNVDNDIFDGVPNETQRKTLMHNRYLRKMITDKQKLMVNFYVRLNTHDDSYEHIKAYVDIEDYGTKSEGGNWLGYIKIKEVPMGKGDDPCNNNCVNPITKAAWNFARLSAPKLVYPGDTKSGGVEAMIMGLVSNITDIAAIFQGANRHFRSENFGIKYKAAKSYIRLYNPIGRKYGGGCRVKKIRISDEWNEMTGGEGETIDYGQEYIYDTKGSAGQEDRISSGVASYEPMIGGDENPFRQPIIFSESNVLAPDNDHYMEEPLGEVHFPSPSICYSEVRVKTLSRKDGSGNVVNKRTATGTTLNEFYTSKEFPTILDKKVQDPKSNSNVGNRLLSLVGLKFERLAVSHGYKIELNDMQGKPKATRYFAENHNVDDPTAAYASTEYFYKRERYKTADDGSPTFKLTNNVLVMGKDNIAKHLNIGVETEMIVDTRFSNTENLTVGADVNLDVNNMVLPTPIPLPIVIPIPPVIPIFKSQSTTFKSAVVTKLVYRYGVQDRTVAFQEGSRVESLNRMWDEETGQVLLTSTENEYDNLVYNLTYPAHWAYDGMGQSGINSSALLKNTEINNDGKMVNSGSSNYIFSATLVPGDEISLNSGTTYSDRLWVEFVSANEVVLIDKDGNPPPSGGVENAKVLRSGRRNQQSTPIGSVQLLIDPIVGIGNDNYIIDIPDASKKVLNASGVEFAEDWKVYCCGEGDACLDVCAGDFNKYYRGLKGNWRMQNTWSYVGQREPGSLGLETQEGGTFLTFEPLWQYSNGAGEWNAVTETGHELNNSWINSEEITLYDPHGNALESRDAINRYTTVHYGFNNTLQVAVAKNSRFREIAYESFEDFEFPEDPGASGCKKRPHFAFYREEVSSLDAELSHNIAHTGRNSVLLRAGKVLTGGRQTVKCETASLANELVSPEYVPVPPENDLECDNCIPLFSPDVDKEYVISAWTNTLSPRMNFESRIAVAFFDEDKNSVGTDITFKPTGSIIDGWQRISGSFVIPSDAAFISVVLFADENRDTFFDDLRLHPFDASIITYVYDPLRLLLLAELDDRNYATLYEYDEAFNLVRVKKETERGVETLNETRSNLRKVSPSSP